MEITHAIQQLIDDGADVRSSVIHGYWKDTGNVVDMLEVNRTVLESMDRRIDGEVDDVSETIGRVVIEEGARIEKSRIVGPVVIGAGTVVSNSYVGPFTSVAENCKITDSELEFSIVLQDSSILGVGRIESSLIGKHVEVTPRSGGTQRPPPRSRRPQQGADPFMNLLVTGAAGFIGSTYVRTLLASDAADAPRITVLDKLTYAGTLDNLDIGHPRLEFVQGDICDAELVDKLMAEADQVVHFAAESHVDRSINGAADFVRTNVVGTQVLLDAALRYRTPFVHISTDEVYGSIETGSWPETHPLAPNSPYSASKASSDLLALAYHRTHGLDVRVTRCSNNYGPHQFPEKVIPLFVSNLLDGKKVPLYGEGLNVRDWLHVEDHCQGIELVRTKGRAGEVYNIGGGTELSNKELTGLLLEACGADWDRVERVEDRKGHDLRYSVDWSKIHDELGYQPQHDFASGLADTVAWYRDNRAWWEPLKARVERG